jgi:hypothetical protein
MPGIAAAAADGAVSGLHRSLADPAIADGILALAWCRLPVVNAQDAHLALSELDWHWEVGLNRTEVGAGRTGDIRMPGLNLRGAITSE